MGSGHDLPDWRFRMLTQAVTGTVREILWTIEQIAIFAWFALVTPTSDLIVRARAGTGKTTTIVEGVKRYVLACRASGRRARALLCAFNKEIATELEGRISGFPEVEAKTLHALGFLFVRMAWRGVRVDFGKGRAMNLAGRVCGNASDNVIALVAELHSKAREIEPLAESPDQIAYLASKFDLVPDQDMEREGWNLDRILSAAIQCMNLATERTAVIDGADMIFLPLANNWVRPTYDRVIVDECQDMTVAQLELARRACKADGFLCLVGDDRQAIYGFRGADSGSLDRLKAELGATELGLTVTYRCGRAIVDLARTIVPDYRCPDNAHEGTISTVARDRMMLDVRPGDFILSRTNAPLASICLALLKDGIRAYIRGKDIGRGLLAIVRKLRIREIADLAPALGTWFEKQSEIARSRMEPDKADARIAMMADQRDVILALSEGCATVPEISARIESLFSDDKANGRVMLSTVHKAKGLEANRVYLLSGTFRASDEGEEANIRYVAITRAKHELCHVTGFEKGLPN